MTPSPQLSPSTLNERAKNQRGNNALEYLRSQGVSVVNETSFLERFTRLDNIARMQAPNSSEMTSRDGKQRSVLLERVNGINEGLAQGEYVADELKEAGLFPLPPDLTIDDPDGSQPATGIHPFEYLPIRFGPVLRDKNNWATGLSELRIPEHWTLVARATTSDTPYFRAKSNGADQLVTIHDAGGRAICAATVATSREGMSSFQFRLLTGGTPLATSFELIMVNSSTDSVSVTAHARTTRAKLFGARRRRTSLGEPEPSKPRFVESAHAFALDDAMDASHTSQRLLRGLAVVAAMAEDTQFAERLETAVWRSPISPALRDVFNDAGGLAMLAEVNNTSLAEAISNIANTIRLGEPLSQTRPSFHPGSGLA